MHAFRSPSCNNVYSLLHSEFSKKCKLLLLLSNSSILISLRPPSNRSRLLPHLLVTSIVTAVTYFRTLYLRKMCPIQLTFLFLISCRLFLFSLTLTHASSFLTLSVQLVFSILLQHHISKLSMYLCSVFRGVQVSTPDKAMLKV